MNFKASAHEKTSNKVYRAINSSIAHKVHGPLGCIVNQSKIFQIMVEQFTNTYSVLKNVINEKDFDKVQQFVEFAKKSGKLFMHEGSKLLLHFEDLVCLSMIKHNNFVKGESKFNIRTAIQDVVASKLYQAKSNDVNVSTHFFGFPFKDSKILAGQPDVEIKEPDHHFYNIEADELRIKQVLLNLQENALKHTPRKGSIFILCQYVNANHFSGIMNSSNLNVNSHRLDLTNKYVNLQQNIHVASKRPEKLVRG